MMGAPRQNVSMSWIWVILGGAAFTIGAIGIVLPVWPTTIFWIFAAFCFANSRPEWRDWIYARPGIGPIIENFNERGILTRQGKQGAIFGMAIGGAIATFFLWRQLMWLSLTWGLIAIGVLFVLSRPSN